ncbi:hypothetical protein Raf01_14890 [Rugosimonospora africana]|uniref:Antitoxin n=2 Tax=Rugosimonospora africana TaxID=556532 RepID=A0A8J3VNW3_9ACTN|nr:hypothetical protein Raf01_14890 [Rugosimonospora africana]
MGMADKAKQKMKQVVDKAGDKADDMTGNKYSDKIDKGQSRAHEGIDSMNKQPMGQQQKPDQQQQ